MRDENGRLLQYKKYADRDLLVMVGGDQHEPDLQWMHYDDIVERNRNPKRKRHGWISHGMTFRFGIDAGLEQRCWYSGVQLYLVPYKLLDVLGTHTPWKASREHLVCSRNGGLGHGNSNIVIAGRYLNCKLGHSPLPLKLLHRSVFASKSFDKETPTWEATRPILDIIIETEEQYKLGEHYPWQPWAFESGTREFKIASGFHEEMLVAEQEFLAQDPTGRQQWIEEFVWKW